MSKKNIYLIVTDEEINGVKDLKKLEDAEFATVSDLDTNESYETFNATLPQASEVLEIVVTCHNALAEKGLLGDESELSNETDLKKELENE